MEDGKGLCCVKWDEDPNQELLVFGLQGQSEAIDDAGGEKKTVEVTVNTFTLKHMNSFFLSYLIYFL